MKLILGLIFFSFSAHASFDLKKQVDTYKQRYNLSDPYMKMTSNQGEGYENLYGTRNFRAVLHGIYYRGGANNSYNRDGKRSNMNPLPNNGLANLCEEGFSEAVYLYSDNFATAPATTACVSFQRDPWALNYQQMTGLKLGNEQLLLAKIYDHIKGKIPGPIYAHCWNGWHASGYVAAISLQQFCQWTPERARAYWVKNTDGNNTGYQKIENRILSFKSFPQFQITETERNLICP